MLPGTLFFELFSKDSSGLSGTLAPPYHVALGRGGQPFLGAIHGCHVTDAAPAWKPRRGAFVLPVDGHFEVISLRPDRRDARLVPVQRRRRGIDPPTGGLHVCRVGCSHGVSPPKRPFALRSAPGGAVRESVHALLTSPLTTFDAEPQATICARPGGMRCIPSIRMRA
jgi:hypothetical protein